jgi:hypothetical protein
MLNVIEQKSLLSDIYKCSMVLSDARGAVIKDAAIV